MELLKQELSAGIEREHELKRAVLSARHELDLETGDMEGLKCVWCYLTNSNQVQGTTGTPSMIPS